MVDPGRLRSLLDRLGEEIEHLRRLAAMAPEEVLGEAGVLRSEQLPALQEMARFRNLLVHGYQRIDDRRVLEILGSRLDDLHAFRAQIARSALEEGE